MFKNRKLIIATKHQKEKVIAPYLEKELGIVCLVDPHFDTDVFGTFSGEIARAHSPIETLRQKCLTAMQANQCDLGVASEGSFGPHPSIPFVTADDELLIFIDLRHNIELVVRELSLATNFNAQTVHSYDELCKFAQQAQFPSHGLILRPAPNAASDIYKGITDNNTLINTYTKLAQAHGSVYVETDMRAQFNPSRMEVIEQATKKLVAQLLVHCPHCQLPGFAINARILGLPCELCKLPTASVLGYIYKCKHCNYEQVANYPNKKEFEDPTYCNFCNP
jgi:hypothetical protein